MGADCASGYAIANILRTAMLSPHDGRLVLMFSLPMPNSRPIGGKRRGARTTGTLTFPCKLMSSLSVLGMRDYRLH